MRSDGLNEFNYLAFARLSCMFQFVARERCCRMLTSFESTENVYAIMLLMRRNFRFDEPYHFVGGFFFGICGWRWIGTHLEQKECENISTQ